MSNNNQKEFVSSIVDRFQFLGPAKSRAMFGGHGIFIEEYMVGLVADSILYLKVNDELAKSYQERMLPHFSYEKNGKRFNMSYCKAPSEVFETMESAAEWLEKSYAIAREAKKRKAK